MSRGVKLYAIGMLLWFLPSISVRVIAEIIKGNASIWWVVVPLAAGTVFWLALDWFAHVARSAA